jgi:hypothetical protein
LNERIIFNISWILHVFQHVHAIWIYHYCGFICFQLRVHGGSIHNVGYIITSGWIYIILHKINEIIKMIVLKNNINPRTQYIVSK